MANQSDQTALRKHDAAVAYIDGDDIVLWYKTVFLQIHFSCEFSVVLIMHSGIHGYRF